MRFEPTLDLVRQHVLPDWFSKAKLGIFIFWGLYSVPARAPPGDDIDRHVAKKLWPAMFASNPYAEWYQNSLCVSDTRARFHGNALLRCRRVHSVRLRWPLRRAGRRSQAPCRTVC